MLNSIFVPKLITFLILIDLIVTTMTHTVNSLENLKYFIQRFLTENAINMNNTSTQGRNWVQDGYLLPVIDNNFGVKFYHTSLLKTYHDKLAKNIFLK